MNFNDLYINIQTPPLSGDTQQILVPRLQFSIDICWICIYFKLCSTKPI